MAAELAASERLNYLSKKQRAVSSRHSRQIINANNGSEFSPGGVTNIQIPGGQAASYMDFQNSYLKFSVKNTTATAAHSIKAASGYDLIQRLEILADGQTISNINNYGVVVDQYMSTEVGPDWKNHLGNAMVGISSNPFGSAASATGLEVTLDADDYGVTADSFNAAAVVCDTTGSNAAQPVSMSGANIAIALDATTVSVGGTITSAEGPGAKVFAGAATGAQYTYCLPLVLCPLFSVNKYIPLVGRSNLQIRITWADRDRAYLCAQAATPTANEIKYTPVSFITSVVRLSADANAMVMANTGGRFELRCSDIRSAQSTHDVSTSSLAVNCGFSFSSLDRVSFAFYPTLDNRAAFGIRNRSRGGLKQYALAINGEEHPRKRIEVGATNIAEALAETSIAHRSLSDFNHQSTIVPSQYAKNGLVANCDGTTSAKMGDFVAYLDTESMQPHSGDTLYSGISTLGSVVQFVAETEPVTGETGSHGLQPFLIFAQFTMALTLDMQGTQTWVVSI